MKQIFITLIAFFGLQISHAKEAPKTIELKVTETGFEPSEIKVTPGTHVILNVTRTTDRTCATEIQVKKKKIKASLKDLNKMVSVDLGVVQKGNIRFACGMDMISGHVIVE